VVAPPGSLEDAGTSQSLGVIVGVLAAAALVGVVMAARLLAGRRR
jgi:hypothetical protein